jgi:hypothetical protein
MRRALVALFIVSCGARTPLGAVGAVDASSARLDAGAGSSGQDGATAQDAMAADDGAAVNSGCPPAALAQPDGGFCPHEAPCDLPPADASACYDAPTVLSVDESFDIWVEDPAAPGGGWRITLVPMRPVTVGGHTYEDLAEGLTGSGVAGLYGDLFVAVDGVPQAIHFHYEGVARYQGSAAWDWPAAVTRTRPGCDACAPASIARRYSIVRSGPCPSMRGTYTFTAEEPPRGCGFGVDLVRMVFPGP